MLGLLHLAEICSISLVAMLSPFFDYRAERTRLDEFFLKKEATDDEAAAAPSSDVPEKRFKRLLEDHKHKEH